MESSRSSSSDSLYTSSSECGGDSMVGSELEAAEALAGLAHSALPPSSTRQNPRVKTESPPPFFGASKPEDAVLCSSYPSEDHSGIVKQQGALACTLKIERMEVEQDAEFHKPSHISNTSNVSCTGSKSRQQLTEAEKEARRIHRVLANRESARQTIRRRQALYEDLTRKASSLACENGNLKKEKEVALEEYDSLKSTNECLKAKMAKTVKLGVVETQVDSKPAIAEIPTSSYPNCPFLVFNQSPFSPFPWPHVIPSSNPVQLDNFSQNPIFVASEVPMPSIAKPDIFDEQENPIKINGQGTPFYIVPYPWFFPIPDHGDGLSLGRSLGPNHEQNGNSYDNPCGASSSSKIIAHDEKNPIKAKPEASSKKDDSGAAEAAEARRKRKELIKLKRLHCR